MLLPLMLVAMEFPAPPVPSYLMSWLLDMLVGLNLNVSTQVEVMWALVLVCRVLLRLESTQWLSPVVMLRAALRVLTSGTWVVAGPNLTRALM